MKIIHCIFLPALLCVLFIIKSYGQNNYIFNYNIYNGLPSNYIYGMISDKYGYLWIATDKGIVKYNGYEFKLFSLSDGLSTDNVWQLLEDKKGKIWLGCTSDEFGNIYNDKYQKAFFRGMNKTIYPKDIRAFKDGIMFYSDYISGNEYPTICLENNDTLIAYPTNKSIFNKYNKILNYNAINNFNATNRLWAAITFSGQPYFIYKASIFKISMNITGNHIDTVINIDHFFFENHFSKNTNVIIGDYFISYSNDKYNSVFYTLNLANGQIKNVNFKKYCVDNRIECVTSDQSNKHFYVITKKNILEFNYENGIEFKKRYSIADMIKIGDIDGTKIRTIQKNRYWGNIIGTIANGFTISYNEKDNFLPVSFPNLKNFSLLGDLQDSISFWWNNTTEILYAIEKNKKIKSFKFKNINKLNSIQLFGKDTFLLNGFDNYYLIYSKGKLIKIDENVFGRSPYLTIIDSHGYYYLISSAGFYSKTIMGNAIERKYIDVDKYNDMVYDSGRKNVLAYNLNKLCVCNKHRNNIVVKNSFSNFNVTKIEKIAIDNRYGNIFFKGTDNITLYDWEKKKAQTLFKNINLKDASVFVYHTTLIVAGRFGVTFSKILGRMQVSNYVLYNNIKDIKYSRIYYCNASEDKVLLNTDKGLYEITIPSDSSMTHSASNGNIFNYKFIFKYRQDVKIFRSEDTIVIDQLERKLLFDVINPYGNGYIKYLYMFYDDSNWHELNANELNILNKYVPGNYHKLYLKAYDDVWRSDTVCVYLRIKPYWYQTTIGRKITWILINLAIVLLLTSLILITRKLVLNAAKKRTLQMELELKAIYAQINPHFIFNTLNSALLLVNNNKMKEAYIHISRFSRLLRAYIKSSRNKFITIAEEINNLKDYIELQQTRFKNKFEFEIVTDSVLQSDHIMIPSLLIQPFVENAINHGILPMNENGRLKVEFLFSEKNNEIICIVEDNGIGRKQSKSINESNILKETSYGNMLIKDLVSIFNKYENINIEIRFTDKDWPQSGTLVTIKIKRPKYVS